MKKLLLLLFTFTTMALFTGLHAQEIKVLSLNIRNSNFSYQDGDNQWINRRNAIVNMIESEHPTVFGLQEALLNQINFLDSKLGRQYYYYGKGRDNGRSRGEHLAIFYDFSQVELTSYATYWLSTTPNRVSKGWDASCMRTVTVTSFRYRETGETFYYINTHLDLEGTTARRESIKQIAQIINNTVPPNIPVILGGDMNSEIDPELFKPLFDIGMEESRRIAYRTDYRNSYNAFGKDHGAMNDHFMSRGINIESFKTIRKGYGVPYISNHYPIVIVFKQ